MCLMKSFFLVGMEVMIHLCGASMFSTVSRRSLIQKHKNCFYTHICVSLIAVLIENLT